MRRLSFVIPNYNYGRFVGRAIGSALAVRWSDVEVIVVDDGSTDDSVEVVRRFGDRIHLIQQPNAGPRVTCNTGFAASSGDWVIFLDSDDLVEPEVAVAIQEHDREGLSKIQFQMQRVDADDKPVGRAFPEYRVVPTPDQVREWMRTTASYPTPPGSGNAYTRAFLEQLFPLGDEAGDATDSATLAAAPFYGDVLTVPSPLMKYRVHGANRSYLLGDVRRFGNQLERALQRHSFAQTVDGHRDDPHWMEPLFHGRHLLQLRVAHRRMTASASPIPGDGFGRMLRDCFGNLVSPGPDGHRRRAAVIAWCLVVLIAPRPMAQLLIRARFAQPA